MSDTLQDFVKTNIHMVDQDMNVFEIFQLMKKHKIRHVPVVEKGEAVGMISDRDLQFVNATGDSLQLKAKDVMTNNPFSVDSMTSVPHVVNAMAAKKINSVLIHDQNKKVVGIFTSTDALKILSELYRPKTPQAQEEEARA